MEHEVQIKDLFDLAEGELRKGLQHLCQVYVSVRGKSRARLIDRALREILHSTMQQASLLENGEGEAVFRF